MTPPVYGALIEQAHKRGLRVAAHLYYLKDAKGLLDAGVDVLAHGIRDQDVDAALIAAMKKRNVGYIPTFTRDLAVFVYDSTPAFFKDPFFVRHEDAYRREMTMISDPALQEKTRNSKEAATIKVALQQGSRNMKTLSDAGITIAMGTDTGTNLGQWQGYFEHVELEYMVKAGLTPMQTLVAATGGARKSDEARPARYGPEGEVGRSAGVERESADRYQEHAPDPLDLDRRPAADERP